jgi:hypothetical protein
MTIKTNPKKMKPPARRTGRGGGRPVSPELVKAMRVVANNPGEWYLIAEFKSRGSASSAANRMRQRDWDEVLNLSPQTHRWDIISRTYEKKEGAGVWARRADLLEELARAGDS